MNLRSPGVSMTLKKLEAFRVSKRRHLVFLFKSYLRKERIVRTYQSSIEPGLEDGERRRWIKSPVVKIC